MRNKHLIPIFIATLLVFSQCKSPDTRLSYPTTKKGTQSDTYFGTVVADPYRWLENDTSAETKEWVKTEQGFTENYLSKIPFRETIKNRYKELLNYDKFFGAFKVGDYIIFTKQEGLQNQSVYYIQKGPEGEAKVLIDPNKLSDDGSVSVALDQVSNDKKYLTYHVNKGGSDWQTMYIMEIATQKKMDDQLDWIKFGGAAWQGPGFYYSRYNKPAPGTELSAKSEFQKIYYHKVGDKQEQDKLVFEDKAHPQMYYNPEVTEDEKYLFVIKSPGTDGAEIIYRNLTNGQKDFKLLFKGFEYNYDIINNVGDKLLAYTNDGAGNYRVIEVDPNNPDKKLWKEIIPEKPEKLESASTLGGKLFVSYLKDASTKTYQYKTDGTFEHEVPLPAIGSASGIGGYNSDTYAFYDFSSFTYPPGIYRYDIATGKSVVFRKSTPKANVDDFETEQVFYTSKDGTKIPMFLVHKKGIKADGSHPTLLYAYGGFGVSSTPYFSNSKIILYENDGIFAMPNIRGGGEYGEKWHKGGNLLNKQNGFDDFIAAAEYLIDQKYTTRDKLAINGGSNGGLLVGAVMTQRPDLFKVAIPEVGVMDMLRFQKFTVGWGWSVEYGSSDSAKYFPVLYKYSPLHNIRKDVEYPATLVMTADHDDRVVPAHSFKFISTLQENQKGTNPVLIRIEINQGHGASGASLSKVIESETDKWSFMFYNMGIEPGNK
ncbi:MAG: prolyl oligopeptidase family serine peptidase [Bacteroidetes bacterium]|nr:prolyl oligopeptidase family serine peptidase [Bacteroidota bacterium]